MGPDNSAMVMSYNYYLVALSAAISTPRLLCGSRSRGSSYRRSWCNPRRMVKRWRLCHGHGILGHAPHRHARWAARVTQTEIPYRKSCGDAAVAATERPPLGLQRRPGAPVLTKPASYLGLTLVGAGNRSKVGLLL